MINDEAIDFMARDDFWWAMRKGFWGSLRSLLGLKRSQLLSFSDVYGGVSLSQQHDLGLQVVDIDRIVGSMGRNNDFDADFYPRQARTAGRWIDIAKAFYRHAGLPAVDLYRIGNDYFVKDGHHRISVARVQGQEAIDARVINIEAGSKRATSS